MGLHIAGAEEKSVKAGWREKGDDREMHSPWQNGNASAGWRDHRGVSDCPLLGMTEETNTEPRLSTIVTITA